MDGIRGLHGWQWMFLLEGLPMIPLGVVTFLFLSNVPNTVQCNITSNTERYYQIDLFVTIQGWIMLKNKF